MSTLLTRSPYIVDITNVNLQGGKIEIFIWNLNTSAPTLPQYTLSKLVPASNVESVYFDISNYINEYIEIINYNIVTNLVIDLDYKMYCSVNVKRYKLLGGTYVYTDTIGFDCFKGYIEQKNGINLGYSNYLLDQKSYNYYYSSSNVIPSGDITAYIVSGFKVVYTNLRTSATITNTISSTGWKNIYRVHPTYLADGNKFEIIDNTLTVVATYYFQPVEECRYTPVTLDFINKYGAWQREFLFKNSTDSINVENQSYKNYRSNPVYFNSQENLLTTFNTNGNESIKCNTGWVDEDFKDNLKQVLLSDRILINDRPATITTKQIELQKNINNKLINYSLDFQFTNSII